MVGQSSSKMQLEGNKECVSQITGANYLTYRPVIFSVNQSGTSDSDKDIEDLVHHFGSFFSPQ